LIFLFLSIDLEKSRSVTDNVSKMNRFNVHLKNKILVVVQLQKSIILHTCVGMNY
jgi:hypothetical protein